MNTLEQMAQAGTLLPADILLFKNGERGLLNFGIRRSQRSALKDFNTVRGTSNCLMPDEELDYFSSFTHASQVGQADNDDTPFPDFFYEQYAPRARVRNLGEVPAGTTVLIKRLKNTTPDKVKLVLDHWKDVVNRKVPYPVRELVYYYFRWSCKVWFARKFAKLFKNNKPDHNVCSGEVVYCSQSGGWFKGKPPEMYYPALLAYESEFTFKAMEVNV